MGRQPLFRVERSAMSDDPVASSVAICELAGRWIEEHGSRYSERFQSRLAAAWRAGWNREPSKYARGGESNYDAPLCSAYGAGKRHREVLELIGGPSPERGDS